MMLMAPDLTGWVQGLFSCPLLRTRYREESSGASLVHCNGLDRPGHPAQTIVQVAKKGKFDLILVGHSGLSGVGAAFWGTTAEKVSGHAPWSVLIVR
jgi:hypothetical protein